MYVLRVWFCWGFTAVTARFGCNRKTGSLWLIDEKMWRKRVKLF